MIPARILGAKDKPKIIFDSVRTPTLQERVAKLFGFTKTGTSTLGKYLRRFFPKTDARIIAGVALIFVGSFLLLLSATRNIGGEIGVYAAYPSPIIDVSTKTSIQIPIEYTYESRGFNWFHSGADLVAPTGTTVRPIMEGDVKETHTDSFGYGNHIILSHIEGYESLYGHLSQILVVPGQKVGINTVLGKSGSTGFSTGPHLHLEVRFNGIPFNPSELLGGI